MPAWDSLEDPHNPENRVAGGISDWVKHSVYLSALTTLLPPPNSAQPPATVYECHAGRGMYWVPVSSERAKERRLLRQGLVYETGKHLRERLSCSDDWYPGSATLIAQLLQQRAPNSRHIMLEWAPDTRAILHSLCHALAHHADVVEAGSNERLDGESYLVERLAQMRREDIILLDPFALFRQRKLHYRRERYWRLLSQWKASKKTQRPALLWFFCAPATVSEIANDRPGNPMPCSYESFASLLANEACLDISYNYAFPCQIRLFAEGEQLVSIGKQIEQELSLLQLRLNKPLGHRLYLRV